MTGSVLTKTAAITSPLTNLGSQLLDMMINRLEHNEKRAKIKKRSDKIKELMELLHKEQPSIIPPEIAQKKGQGADPHSRSSSFTTILSGLCAVGTAGFSAAIVGTTALTTPLVVGACVGIGTYAGITAFEEQHKAAMLDQHLETLKHAKRKLVRHLVSTEQAEYADILSTLYPKEKGKEREQHTPSPT